MYPFVYNFGKSERLPLVRGRARTASYTHLDVYKRQALDYDKDGKKDLLFCGNQLHTRLRFGHYDANFGVLLHNDGQGKFNYVPQARSGFMLQGEVRSAISVNNYLFFGINQQGVVSYKSN